ncbi:aconitase family protein, partial [Salmonella enterica subsp. enterica serovar Montevideo]|nr:aconitase family protein [Salmonella enterica subsp. enterica serovar Montevideo]
MCRVLLFVTPSQITSSISSTNHVPYQLPDGAVVIAAITSCTNTSNPSVLMAAGLLAKKAVTLGLK